MQSLECAHAFPRLMILALLDRSAIPLLPPSLRVLLGLFPTVIPKRSALHKSNMGGW